jgi:thiol-disulfide isomerase/thioredoxin
MLAELLPWPSASISLEPGATWTDDRVFKDYDTFPGPRVWTTVRRDNLLRVEMASPRQVCAPHSGRHERHETTLESYSKVFHLDLRSRIPRRFERVRVTTMKESDSVITYDLRIALDRTGVGTADTAVLRSGCEAAKKALDAVVGIDGVDERALEDVVKLHSSHLSKIPDPHIRDHALEDLRRAADRKRDSWEYQEAKNEVESRLLNKAAPEVGGKDFGGHDVGLSKLKGSVVILSFWHSTCTPCRAEVPHLNRALERYRDRGLVVLALNKEDTPNEREAVKSFKFAYPVILGAQDAFKAYGTTGIPCLVFIDRKGIVRAREVGFGKDVPERIEATVKELIEEPGVAPK